MLSFSLLYLICTWFYGYNSWCVWYWSPDVYDYTSSTCYTWEFYLCHWSLYLQMFSLDLIFITRIWNLSGDKSRPTINIMCSIPFIQSHFHYLEFTIYKFPGTREGSSYIASILEERWGNPYDITMVCPMLILYLQLLTFFVWRDVV